MNREQRRAAEKGKAKAEKVDFNKKASDAAQTLLDASAIIVKGIKGGQDPTHLEVFGLAGIILKDVYEELMKEMVQKNEQANAEASTTKRES